MTIVKEKQEFDLVITDLKMPNINGITLVEHLPPDVPAIIISGFLQIPMFQEAVHRLNPAAVLQKPFKVADILGIIEEMAGKAKNPEPEESTFPDVFVKYKTAKGSDYETQDSDCG